VPKLTRASPETVAASEIGETHTTLIAGAASEAASPAALQLLVLEPNDFAVYPLPEAGTISIGRAEDCHVQLKDALASRRHATLHLRPLAIEDDGSANGTLLGDSPLQARMATPVQPGQAMHIGKTVLLLRRTDVAASPTHAPGHSRSSTRIAANARVVRQPAMVRLYALVERLAQGSINVLVLGETGVGKEVVAEALHRASPRNEAPFVRINCAALAEPLLESELFGHERGAFTGAVSAKPGLVELANGGTVFLDEVGELSPSLQAKLLRVIEAREVTRVGGVRSTAIDVRFISATNRNIDGEAAVGTFRPDLLFRLNGASVDVPPLRERPLEILPLAELFLARAALHMNLARPPLLTSEAVTQLLAHGWPGNVRELRNAIERAVLLCSGSTIAPADLSLDRTCGRAVNERALSERPTTIFNPVAAAANTSGSAELGPERDRIVQALLECGGNQSRAAAFLGMPRRTLVRKIAQLGLPRPRRSS
jgi:two-component system, NtrC family, response regulator AtoC